MPLSPSGQDLPVDEHLEVAVVLGGAQAAALAVEDQHAIHDLPVRPHVVIGLFLELLRPDPRPGSPVSRVVIRSLQQSLPAGQVLAIEQGHKAFRRLVQRLLRGRTRRRQKQRSRQHDQTHTGWNVSLLIVTPSFRMPQMFDRSLLILAQASDGPESTPVPSPRQGPDPAISGQTPSPETRRLGWQRQAESRSLAMADSPCAGPSSRPEAGPWRSRTQLAMTSGRLQT